jgi:Fe-S-cluster-containing dehydrogenase component
MSFDKEPSKKSDSRRNFLKAGIVLTALAATANLKASALFNNKDATPSGDMVKLMSPDGEIVEIDSAYLKPIPELPDIDYRKGITGKKFVMVIDLSRCKNLRKCHDACEKKHVLTPEKEWLKVLKMKYQEDGAPYWQPTMCFHCDRPPCVKVCPVGATYKREDGIVLVDNERCIGCRFCMVACPYSARVFDWSEPDDSNLPDVIQYSPETGVPARMGTVSKCDFCPDMARQGKVPVCVTACPNGVLYYGDENEDTVTNGVETVRLSQLLKDKAGYRFLEDLGTQPRVYYLPPVDRQFEFEDDEYTKDNNHE